MKAIITIVLLFLLTQLFGIYLGYRSISMISKGEMEPIVSNPTNPFNSIILFLYIIMATGVIIVILKYKKQLLLYIENLAAFFLISLTLDFFLPLHISIALTVFLLFWTNKKPNTVNKNLCTILSVSSAGAILGASIGLLPTLIFCLILAVYDFISVFITKHMVYLAKEIVSRPNVFTISTPLKGRRVLFGKEMQKIDFVSIGSGDLFIPLMFSVSVLHSFGIISAIASVIAATFSLFIMYLILLKRKVSRVLPALPILFFGSLVGFILSIIS